MHIYQTANTAYIVPMATAKEIRRGNLKILIEEEGSAVVLAEKADTNPAYISQLLSQKTDRGMGAKIARRLEAAYEKPRGWMDEPHISSISEPSPAYGAELDQELYDDCCEEVDAVLGKQLAEVPTKTRNDIYRAIYALAKSTGEIDRLKILEIVADKIGKTKTGR